MNTDFRDSTSCYRNGYDNNPISDFAKLILKNAFIKQKINDFKNDFFYIFLQIKDNQLIKNKRPLYENYEIKKSGIIYLIFFPDIIILLNTINDELTLENAMKKYDKIENWEEIFLNGLIGIYDRLKIFKKSLNLFAEGVKIKMNTQNSNLVNSINYLIYENILEYKNILHYMLDIYKCMFNVEKTDYRIFIKYRYENKKPNVSKDLKLNNHVYKTNKIIITEKCNTKYNPYGVDINMDCANQNLTNLHLLDFQIQQVEKLIGRIKLSVTNNHSFLDNLLVQDYISEFIQNRLFCAIFDDNFSDFINKKMCEKSTVVCFFENIFPVDNNYSFLFSKNYFRYRFYEKIVAYKNKIILLSGNTKNVKNVEMMEKLQLKISFTNDKRYCIEMDGKNYSLSIYNILTYEINVITKLFIDLYLLEK